MDKTVGQRIEALAAERGLPSGKALAALFGVSYETLRKWRTDEVAPNRSRQAKIAEVLNVAPEAFMHGVQSRTPDADQRLQRLIENYRTASVERQRIIYAVAETMNGPGATALMQFFGQLGRAQSPTPALADTQRTPDA